MLVRSLARKRAGVALMVVLGLAASGAATAYGSASPGGRGYEVVSPAQKNGGDIAADTGRTRAATDGNAVSFAAVTGFGDVAGTGIATDYIAQRSELVAPGDNGWHTHGITPRQDPLTLLAAFQGLDPLYVGEFSADLSQGVFRAWSPVTPAPNVALMDNLYLRSDLLNAGSGTYQLITDSSDVQAATFPTVIPWLGGASSDFSRIVFESRLNLIPGVSGTGPKTYLWDQGVVSFLGVLSDGSPALCPNSTTMCSIVGQGATNETRVQLMRAVSSDGRRVNFTVPTSVFSRVGNGVLYQRVDGTATIHVNASERTDCAQDISCGGDGVPDPAPDPSGAQPAKYWWASADGQRIFFTTPEELTDDDDNSVVDLYVYDVALGVGEHLTRVSVDSEMADGSGDTDGVVGASADGRYVYFVAVGLLVPGTPGLDGATRGLYVWHDGEIRLVAPFRNVDGNDRIQNLPGFFVLARYEARVTPDGRHLLFTLGSGAGVLSLRGGVDYEHAGFRQKYVYSFDTDELECASCDPTGAPARADALASVRDWVGAASTTTHINRSMSDDGRHVFFATRAGLVADDTNGRIDVYEYDTVTDQMALVSSGRSTADSYFLDADPTGRDVFFVTRDALVGWDRDLSYDLYDARIGGGFPEPPAPPVACSGDACRSQEGTAPGRRTGTSGVAQGSGDEPGALRHRVRCRRGFHKKKIKGKRRCVKRRRSGPHRRRGASRSRRAK